MNEQLWIPTCTRAALTVMKNVCDDAWLDGFTAESLSRIAARTNVAADQVAAIIADLEDAGLIACRRNGADAFVLEPTQVMYALVGWLQTSSRRLAA